MTTKGLRYIQMRENAVRESVQDRTIEVQHVGGKKNPSDIFTKEDRDVTHFQECRDALCSTPPVKPSSCSVNPTDLPLLELRSKGGCCLSGCTSKSYCHHGAIVYSYNIYVLLYLQFEVGYRTYSP